MIGFFFFGFAMFFIIGVWIFVFNAFKVYQIILAFIMVLIETVMIVRVASDDGGGAVVESNDCNFACLGVKRLLLF